MDNGVACLIGFVNIQRNFPLAMLKDVNGCFEVIILSTHE